MSLDSCDKTTVHGESDSCIDSGLTENNINIELNKMLSKKKIKNLKHLTPLTTDDSECIDELTDSSCEETEITETTPDDEIDDSSDLIKATSEMRVDVLRMLMIIQKLSTEVKTQKEKIANLEENLSHCNNSTNGTETDNVTVVSSVSSSINDLNEYEIKLDTFKNDVNAEFALFREKMIHDFNLFKANIVEASRIRSQQNVLLKGRSR
jgi:hypothetical protein